MRAALDSPSGALYLGIVLWSYTHFLAHFGIALGYLGAMTRNNSVINSLMRISRFTKICGAGFFLFCGITHIGLATHTSESPVVTATDHLQLVAIYGFLIGLYFDSRRVVIRLANAFRAISEEFDGLAVVRGAKGREMIDMGTAESLEVGASVVATIDFALHGHGSPSRPDARGLP